MAPKYSKIGATKKVSFDDDPTRYNFEAPRLSHEVSFDAPRTQRSSLLNEKNDESDDEVDKLLSSDPMDDKEEQRKQKRPRLTRKKRRVLIFGFLTSLLLLVATITVVGIQTHARVKSKAQVQEVQAAMDEIKNLNEVPTLIGTVPITESDVASIEQSPDMPHLVKVDDSISVPANHEPVHDEEADRAGYEAGLEPPELSETAVAQTQDVNATLNGSKVGTVAAFKGYASDLWDWIEAQWNDLMANDPKSEEVIY